MVRPQISSQCALCEKTCEWGAIRTRQILKTECVRCDDCEILYDDKQRFVANPLGRHQLGSYDKIKTNADGSIDIHISSADPGKDKEANWLPAPKGPFNLILRVYWPKQELIDGRWNAPGIRPSS